MNILTFIILDTDRIMVNGTENGTGKTTSKFAHGFLRLLHPHTIGEGINPFSNQLRVK